MHLYLNIAFAFLLCLDFVYLYGIHMFKKIINKSMILKEIPNTTISRCYSKCWLHEQQCVVVGFLLDEINNKNVESLKCYLINNHHDENDGAVGEVIQLDVIKTPYKYEMVVYEESTSTLSTTTTTSPVIITTTRKLEGGLYSSKILNSTEQHINFITTKIDDHNPSGKTKDYQLCWSKMGKYENTASFQSHCAGKAPTITIFGFGNGKIYAGYTDKIWTESQWPIYISTSNALIFDMSTVTPSVYLIATKDYAMHRQYEYGPCFGEHPGLCAALSVLQIDSNHMGFPLVDGIHNPFFVEVYHIIV